MEHCGQNLDIRVLGNAPWAVYKYKYPRKFQEKTGKTGEKVHRHFLKHFLSDLVESQKKF
jgi:hypothetical protein